MKKIRNNFSMQILKHMKGIYIIGVVLIIIACYLGYNNLLLNNKIKYLKAYIIELKENINDNSIEVSSINVPNKDSGNESVSDFYNRTISRVDTLVGVVGVVVALFIGSAIYLSWINLKIGKEFQERLNQIDLVSKDVAVLNAMKYFISGLTYHNDRKIKYAIEEFQEGIKYNHSAISQIKLAIIYADLYAMNKNIDNSEELIDNALLCLDEVNENEDQKIMAEFFHTKGCLYGMKANMLHKNDNNKHEKKFYEKLKLIFCKNDINTMNINELYEQSLKYFKKAIKLRNDQYEYYTNTALTYHYLNKSKETIRYFNLAKKTVEVDEISRWLNIDIFDIFPYDDLLEMGKTKFNEYRYQVEGKKDSEENFKQRLNKIINNESRC